HANRLPPPLARAWSACLDLRVNLRSRFEDNPFYVLALRPGATLLEIERAGQKWISLLKLDAASARAYQTPLGPRERTEDRVRAALGEWRDPAKRLAHEIWATLAPEPREPPTPSADSPPGAALLPCDAMRLVG